MSSNFTLKIASTGAYSYAKKCQFNVSYPPPPPPSSPVSAYCESGFFLSLLVTSQIDDLSNTSWSGTQSYIAAYNDSYFDNSTYCYNYGVPYCYNTTGIQNYTGIYSAFIAGTTGFLWNGKMSWTNVASGRNMVKSHQYVLVVSVQILVSTVAESLNLKSTWSGSSSGAINLSTLGNGVALNSIMVQ